MRRGRSSPWRNPEGVVRRALLRMDGVTRAEAVAAGLDADFVREAMTRGVARAVARRPDKFLGRPRDPGPPDDRPNGGRP